MIKKITTWFTGGYFNKWRRRDSNPGPNTAIVKPSTCLAGLNFRGQKAVRRTCSDPYLL